VLVQIAWFQNIHILPELIQPLLLQDSQPLGTQEIVLCEFSLLTFVSTNPTKEELYLKIWSTISCLLALCIQSPYIPDEDCHWWQCSSPLLLLKLLLGPSVGTWTCFLPFIDLASFALLQLSNSLAQSGFDIVRMAGCGISTSVADTCTPVSACTADKCAAWSSLDWTTCSWSVWTKRLVRTGVAIALTTCSGTWVGGGWIPWLLLCVAIWSWSSSCKLSGWQVTSASESEFSSLISGSTVLASSEWWRFLSNSVASELRTLARARAHGCSWTVSVFPWSSTILAALIVSVSRPASQNTWKRSHDESQRRIYARKLPHAYTLSLK